MKQSASNKSGRAICSEKKAIRVEEETGGDISARTDGRRHLPTIGLILVGQTAFQAEAQALVLAANIIIKLQIQGVTIFTDNLSLANIAATRSPRTDPGHWEIRGLLAEFCAITDPTSVQVFHISRIHNKEAHDLAQLAIQHKATQTFQVSCSNENHIQEDCPLKLLCACMKIQGIVTLNVNCLYSE